MPLSLGKYYDQVALGRVFIGSTAAAGTTYPLSTGTAMTFGLWNTSSNKWAVLLRLGVGFTSGTIALGTVGLAHINKAGNAIGTPISAFTDAVFGTTLRNALLGDGRASTMRFTPSAATIAAVTAAYWTGLSHEGATGVGPAADGFHDFDGSVVLPPNEAVFVVGSIAQTALFSMSLVWAEVDAQ